MVGVGGAPGVALEGVDLLRSRENDYSLLAEIYHGLFYFLFFFYAGY